MSSLNIAYLTCSAPNLDCVFIDWYGEIGVIDVLGTEVAQITEICEKCGLDECPIRFT